MRKKIQILLTLIFMAAATFSQQIQRIDGSTITADSLAQKITYLMRAANVSGVAISVFNDNNPVYSQTFGYANVPGKTLWTPNSDPKRFLPTW